jgi:Ulp1 family protease
LNDTKIEKASRMFVPPSAKQNTFVADRKQNDILLIYPFAWDKEKIERAADGLNEAGANSMLEQESEADETSTTKEPPRSASPAPETSEDSSDNRQAIKARKRAHHLTVRAEEHGRLDPDEWLNDTLIDFWMQW